MSTYWIWYNTPLQNKPRQRPQDTNALQEMVLALQSQIKTLEQQYQHLIEPFRLAQQQRFGRSSEKHPAQPDLFNEAEIEVDTTEPEKEQITYTRKKPVRKKLPEDLPREVIEHDIDEADKVCDCCGKAMHRIGEECSEKLVFIPATVKVIEHVRPKYGCRHCDKQGTEVNIKIAPLPPSIMPKSIATPSLLAQIITSKFQYSLPLYR
jgi:transposase